MKTNKRPSVRAAIAAFEDYVAAIRFAARTYQEGVAFALNPAGRSPAGEAELTTALADAARRIEAVKVRFAGLQGFHIRNRRTFPAVEVRALLAEARRAEAELLAAKSSWEAIAGTAH